MRKRPDGYHEIASLYQAIDLFDRLFFSLASSDRFTTTDPTLPMDGSNLVVKALHSFRSRFPIRSVHIHLEKQIPVQAGLGGGSSNAATTLWGLNELAGRPASLEQLIEMGALLGSDVPFFFSNGTAYCTGRGELLEPFPLPEPLHGFLAKPNYGLSTPLVYQHVSISDSLDRDPRTALAQYPCFFNDLEAPAFRLEPRLRSLQQALQRSFRQVVMTGSGTAFFCLDGTPEPISGVSFFPFRSTRRTEWY